MKKNRQRKGLVLEATGIIILFAVSLMVLLVFFGFKMWPALSQSGPSDLCRQSIITHAGKPLEVFRGQIICPINELKVSADLSSDKGQDQAKKVLSKSLYDCFDKFGAGKLDLFSRQGVYCSVCDRIEFSDARGKVKGLTKYLGTERVPFKDISYLDFLAGFESSHFKEYMDDPLLFSSKEANAAIEIDDTSKPWATILVYARGEDSMNRIRDALSPSLGGSGGRLIGVGSAGVIAGAGGATAGLILMGLGPAGWITAALSAVTFGSLTAYTVGSFDDVPQRLVFARLVPYEARSFEMLGCETLPVKTR